MKGFRALKLLLCKQQNVRVRLLVGQASAARMPPSSLHGCIHGGLSGKQPHPEDYFHLPGNVALS